jgi:hypothetical protein
VFAVNWANLGCLPTRKVFSSNRAGHSNAPASAPAGRLPAEEADIDPSDHETDSEREMGAAAEDKGHNRFGQTKFRDGPPGAAPREDTRLRGKRPKPGSNAPRAPATRRQSERLQGFETETESETLDSDPDPNEEESDAKSSSAASRTSSEEGDQGCDSDPDASAKRRIEAINTRQSARTAVQSNTKASKKAAAELAAPGEYNRGLKAGLLNSVQMANTKHAKENRRHKAERKGASPRLRGRGGTRSGSMNDENTRSKFY